MKLWLLRPRNDLPDVEDPEVNPWKPWYDKSFGFVIRAETEDQARELAQLWGEKEKQGEDYSYVFPAWTDPKYSECSEVTADGDEKIILQDYRAALTE